MKQKFYGITFCVIIFTAGLVAAFSSGPPDGRTGAPGESNCSVSCHSSFPLNSGSGTLTVNAPATYEPNSTSIITINVAQSGQERWGFEATALDTNDLFVGFFMNDDPSRTQISSGGARHYIKHTSIGTDPGIVNTSPGWEIHWVAPASSVGPVTLYVAGNAANNNNNNQGDYIYTTSVTINPAPPASCCVGIRGNVDGDGGEIIDISDLVFLVDFMFTDGPAPPCPIEGNVDGDGSELIDISDLVYLVDFMFTNGPAPPSCP